MLQIVRYAGPFAAPLLILTGLVGVLLIRALLQVRPAADRAAAAPTGSAGHALLFWGFVAAVLGFLGQCTALYNILTTVVTAEALSPEIVAEGFASSFVPTLWGVALLTVAGAGWLLPRWLGRRGPAAAVLAAAMLTLGCSPGPAQTVDVTRGAWAGDGGPDTFLFELRGTAPDALQGTVFVMREGRMVSQLPITRAAYRPPDLEMFIERTNATYRGRIRRSGDRVRGSLTFGAEPGPDMELRWVDPADLPGYAARASSGPYRYAQPTSRADGWPSAPPEEVQLERGALEALVNRVAAGDAGLIHSLTVVRNGVLVLDEYFHGFTDEDLHRLASATKSVSSLLVGAAVDRGTIASVDEPLLGLLGASTPSEGSAWEDETLHHLLTMTMGLDWSPQELDAVHGTGPAFYRQVLSRRVATPPGTEFAYASANVNLLAGILRNATGESAESLARSALFDPLGISVYDWSYGQAEGDNLMDGSLQLRPRDLAKIGAMVASGGRWLDRQVVSRAWIEASTCTYVDTGEPDPVSGYGYLWWTGALPTSQGSQPLILANGWGSQFIIILPDLDLVVVTTGGNEDNGRHLDIGRVLMETLLAAL